jgi:hypothetical protein
MAEIDLTQAEADALIAMEKHSIGEESWDYPLPGASICIPLASPDRRENFLLDVSRGRIDLLKGTYQERGRQVVPLVRLDFGGPPRRNPDQTEVACPHLHIYEEGYADKWARPVPLDRFSNLNDSWLTLDEFMRYCNVTKQPIIQQRLLA